MLRRSLIAVVLVGLLASPALAQSRIEASGFFGYTFSEGVTFPNGAPTAAGIYNRVDPASGMNYGFTFGGYVTEQAEIEFLFSRQSSTLELTGTGPKLSGDMTLYNYHGNFIYNFGEEAYMARPFVFLGLGATQYGEATFPVQAGLNGRVVPGVTKFSWSLGGGVKVFPSPHVGVKAMLRWVPTYIRSDGYGWWCDPYYGCGAAVNVKYSNQFEISGGIVARF